MDLRFWVLLTGAAGAGFVGWLSYRVLKEPQGSPEIRELSRVIRQGASAFLFREYVTLLVFAGVVFALLAVFIEPRPWVAVVFLIGSLTSSLAGFIGMSIATRANGRTTSAARTSWSRGLEIAFSSGAVMGFSVTSLGLIGVTAVSFFSMETTVLLAYAFGASSTALFLRVGGGIFTKSADIGADMVGKVEKGIPEDDPRNPAVIADNVGDNVGDVAGMGSDLYESYVSAIIAAVVIGASTIGTVEVMLVPLFLGGAGIAASMLGVLAVRPGEFQGDYRRQISRAQRAMGTGTVISNIIMIIAGFFVIWVLMDSLDLFWALLSGLAVGFLIAVVTEYYTSISHGPSRHTAEAARCGAAFNIIEGLASGMMSTALPILGIAAATVLSYYFAGLLGIAVAALGMLANLGMLLAMDCYGPIADNSAGIAEMAGLGSEVRERCEALDSVGNTTAALGKGFAIGSAALAALAWLATYFEVTALEVASLGNADVIAGIFVGGMLTYIFTSITMKAVGRGGFEIVNEVRRQFREIPGIMEGTARPDYVRCVDIATRHGLRSMAAPGIIAVAAPVIIGLVLGAEAIAGLLIGALLASYLTAVMMANSGGAWDNAKKYIEAGNLGGKNSEAHRAAVTGDMVGDPFKDTSGPSLNILVKLVGVVAVLFAPSLLNI